MRNGVVDPKTGIHYETYVKKKTAVGFSMCDDCENLAKQIAQARTPEEKECYERKLAQHHQVVYEDRMELARIARLCKIDERHVGFMIDAVDKQKFQIPTTASDAKCLRRLNRMIQKITGVQWLCHAHTATLTLSQPLTLPQRLTLPHSHSGFTTSRSSSSLLCLTSPLVGI